MESGKAVKGKPAPKPKTVKVKSDQNIKPVREGSGKHRGPDESRYEKVRFEGNISRWGKKQQAEVEFVDFVAKNFSGNKVHVYESYKNTDGQYVYTDSKGSVRKTHNGVYVEKDGNIYLDLNAGNHSEGLVLNTFAHELYHHIEMQAPEQAKALAEFIAKELGEENVEAAVNRQIEKARNDGYGESFFEEQGMSAEEARQMVRDRAYSDFIADGLETMFTKGDVVQKLADLHRQDKGLSHTIRKFIRKWVSKLREFYNAGNTLSIEGRLVAELKTFDEIQQMFAKALKIAGENYRTQKNTAGGGGVDLFSLNDNSLTPGAEGAVDTPNVLFSHKISELTEEDVYKLIENSNHGEYAKDTFVPVRRDTPPLLVELSQKEGLVPVKNLPILMNVEHIQQCMDEEVAANDGKRGHALTTENIIEIIKGLDSPRYVFFQKDNKRYCEVVEYAVGIRGEKALAIVTYTGNKNQDLMNGFPGREYNILVTAYPPDSKYWKNYQKSSNNLLIYDKIKDVPQGSYGSHVPSLLSGSPFATKVTQPDPQVKKNSVRDSEGAQHVHYSSRDEKVDPILTYTEIEEERQKLHNREMALKERKRKAENDPELLQAMDDYHSLFTELRTLLPKKRNGSATHVELDRIEEIKTLRDDYMKRITNLQEGLGLSEIAKEETEIREEKERLRIASDAAWAREGAERENKAIAKAGSSASEYFRRKALKVFKTTNNFNEAGYLLPDGKLLDFSGGERNHRYRDHREIGEIYEATQGAAALNRFLNDGNIRIMAESPGIDIAADAEPTNEQYAAIRRFVISHGVKNKQFFVDFSASDGHRAGNYSYDGYVNAERVINDIKYYFENGEVREQSSVEKFLRSTRDTESVSNRSLLANALDSVAQDESEKRRLAEYREAIGKLEGYEKHLAELKEQIRELSFGKGPRDMAKIRALKDEAIKTANRIGIYDKKLLRLESTKTLERLLNRETERVRQLEKQRGLDAKKKAVAEARAAGEQKLKDVRAAQKRNVESRHKTQARHEIQKTAGELKKLFARGKDARNVKQEMRDKVAKSLELAEKLFDPSLSDENLLRSGVEVVMTAQMAQRFREGQELMAQLDAMSTKDPQRPKLLHQLGKIRSDLEDVFSAERERINGTAVSDLMDGICNAYQELQHSDKEYIRAAYDPDTLAKLQTIKDNLGAVRAVDMDLSKALYLNIRNPLQHGNAKVSRDRVRTYLEAIAENEDYSIENYGTCDVDKILQTVIHTMMKQNFVIGSRPPVSGR